MEGGGYRCYGDQRELPDASLPDDLWAIPAHERTAILAWFCAFNEVDEATYDLCSRFPAPQLPIPDMSPSP